MKKDFFQSRRLRINNSQNRTIFIIISNTYFKKACSTECTVEDSCLSTKFVGWDVSNILRKVLAMFLSCYDKVKA